MKKRKKREGAKVSEREREMERERLRQSKWLLSEAGDRAVSAVARSLPSPRGISPSGRVITAGSSTRWQCSHQPPCALLGIGSGTCHMPSARER